MYIKKGNREKSVRPFEELRMRIKKCGKVRSSHGTSDWAGEGSPRLFGRAMGELRSFSVTDRYITFHSLYTFADRFTESYN